MDNNKLIKLANHYDIYGDFKKADIITAKAVRLANMGETKQAVAGELSDLAQVVISDLEDGDSRLHIIAEVIHKLWHLVYQQPKTVEPIVPNQMVAV